MEHNYGALFRAIRQKCENNQWFGPDVLNPNALEVVLATQPRLRQYHPSIIAPDDSARFGFVHSPASQEQLQTTEDCLGFTLPPLLRTLYMEIANGGFGPAGGLRGICGGYGSIESGTHTADCETVIEAYRWRSEKQRIDLADYQARWRSDTLCLPYGEWPAHLLPLCDMGDVIEACIDEQEHLLFAAASESDDCYLLRRSPWTLETWLWNWVKGARLI